LLNARIYKEGAAFTDLTDYFDFKRSYYKSQGVGLKNNKN